MMRLRIFFTKEGDLKYISHLDLMRLWHRAFRRAGIPLAYSGGFNPQPRISIAAPLPVGVTSHAEMMDVYLERRISPEVVSSALQAQLPRGIRILKVQEIWPGLPSLQSQVRFVEYQVLFPRAGRSLDEVREAIAALLSKKTLPWEHMRDKEVRRYDLRQLIDDIWISEWGEEEFVLGMRLRFDNTGGGRADQVASALGLPEPKAIHRTRIILAGRM